MNLPEEIEREALVVRFVKKLPANLGVADLYILLAQTDAAGKVDGLHLALQTRQGVPPPIEDIAVVVFPHEKIYAIYLVHGLLAFLTRLVDLGFVWLEYLFSVDIYPVNVQAQAMLLHVFFDASSENEPHFDVHRGDHGEVLAHAFYVEQVVRGDVFQHHLEIVLVDILFLCLEGSHFHEYVFCFGVVLTVVDDLLETLRIPSHDGYDILSFVGGDKRQFGAVAQSSQSSDASEAFVHAALLGGVGHVAKDGHHAMLRNASSIVLHRDGSFVWVYLDVDSLLSLFQQMVSNGFVHLVGCVLDIFSVDETAVLIHAKRQRLDDVFANFRVGSYLFFFCHDQS